MFVAVFVLSIASCDKEVPRTHSNVRSEKEMLEWQDKQDAQFEEQMLSLDKEGISLGVLANDPNSLVGDTVHSLCIGCGCFKARRRCLRGLNESCITVPGNEIMEDCCIEQFGGCNTCSSGPVCVRFGIASDLLGDTTGGTVILPMSDLTASQMAQIVPFQGTIDRVTNGEPLNAADVLLLNSIDK